MARSTPVKLAFSEVQPEGGACDKSPIIFAHGLSASKEHWDDIVKTVADATKRKVYAIDARNHGDSDWNDEFSFDCNVEDILHFMDTQEIPRAIIIGHSMGGFTGIKTAVRAPERVEKLIVEDVSVKRPPAEVIGMVMMLTALLRNALKLVPSNVDEETARKIILGFVISQIPEETKNVVKPESLESLKIQLKRAEDGSYSYKANIDILEKALQNSAEIMKEIEGVYEGPAFFVYGKLSPFLVGMDESNIRKHFPNAELTGIENATQSVHSDCPKEFTEAILNFVLKEY